MGKSKTHTRKRRVRRKRRHKGGEKTKKKVNTGKCVCFSRRCKCGKNTKHDSVQSYYTGQPGLRPHRRNTSNTMYKWWLDEWDEFLGNEGVGKKYEGGFRRRKKRAGAADKADGVRFKKI